MPQPPKRSSWWAAILSFLQEFFLNGEAGGFYYDYEDELSAEGKRKKDLIKGPLYLTAGVGLVLLPLWRGEIVPKQSLALEITAFLLAEAVAVLMIVLGIRKIWNGITHRKCKQPPK